MSLNVRAARLGLAPLRLTVPPPPAVLNRAVSVLVKPANVPGAACTPLESTQLPLLPQAPPSAAAPVHMPVPLNTLAVYVTFAVWLVAPVAVSEASRLVVRVIEPLLMRPAVLRLPVTARLSL